MSKPQPDIKIRHAVATWSEDSPRGAVTAFCRKHNVSRAWFYRVRAAAAEVGPVKALEKKPTIPRTMPALNPQAMIELLLGTRAELQESGQDHGPLSVIAKLSRQGFTPPSRATVARIFSRAGVVMPEPRKKPRSAYKRFVYPQPNACWQIDSTEWQLASGKKVAIFQLIDDHSRLALASLVAPGETSAAAIAVVTQAIERHGAPQKFLSDNGSALNPTRRGRTGALVEFLKAKGIEPITGTIMFFGAQGTEIITHPRPPHGTTYVGNGKPSGVVADPQGTRKKRTKYPPRRGRQTKSQDEVSTQS